MTTTRPSHQHDAWMIREDPDGEPYCAACGESLLAENGEPTVVELLAVQLQAEMPEVPVYVTVPNPDHAPLGKYEVID